MENLPHCLLLLSTFFCVFSLTRSQPFIGVNYGEVANNLPQPDSTARLLQSTTISKLRLYVPDPAIIRSLVGTNISIVVGTTNGEIPSLAANPSVAAAWASSNVLPFIPSSSISSISVGNELLTADDPSLSSNLLPAMRNLRSAIPSGIRISTVHSMAVLSQSDPPSSGAFRPDLLPSLQPILQFLREDNSPFMVNPYPYFAYQSDPRPETLDFCLFRPNPGRLDPGSGITYTNMFDAQVAAVRSALRAAGFAGMEVVVAETGWPYAGDAGEAGASVENAKGYNGNLVAHLRAMAEPVETFIFALYDENLKPGPTSERSFGLFRTDLTPIYDAGLIRSGVGQAEAQSPSPANEKVAPPPPPTPPPRLPPPPPLLSPPPPPTMEACVGPCGQPSVQNMPSNFDGGGAGAGQRRGRRREVAYFLVGAVLSAIVLWV